MAPKIRIVQDPDGEEVPADVIAASIVEMSTAMRRISTSRLNRKGLLVLLSHATGLTQRAVDNVLVELEHLEKTYCKPGSK